jgi:HEAT repeats
MPFAT